MVLEKKEDHPAEKVKLHLRNKHRQRYDFELLTKGSPDLAQFVKPTPYGHASIDFFQADAVKSLNTALLKQYYGIEHWDIPPGYLCPPIPGRADYIHYVADLLVTCNNNIIPVGAKINCLDIGVGANCIYPIIGTSEYGWSFVGADIDQAALNNAGELVRRNKILEGKIELRLQTKSSYVFENLVQNTDLFDLTICNPPFHSSLEDANAGTIRKLSNLKKKKVSKSALNFGGQSNELWCEGGEVKFINQMIFESTKYASSCFWFTTLVAKSTHLKQIYSSLEKLKATRVETIAMGQGNKASRVVAWTFLSEDQQKNWVKDRWMIK